MRSMLWACAAVVLLLGSSASAGPVLDDILNTMQIDQSLSRSGDDWIPLSREQPVGQTFVTGASVARICRIALYIGFNDSTWTPGESLVLTLWDSPAKRKSLGEFGVPHERRLWSAGMMMFSVEAEVEPGREYYFELTCEGGDGTVGNVLLSKWDKEYPAGQRHLDGKPQDRDLWFETHVKKTADRGALYADFFANFDLNRAGLDKVKAAVESSDWDAACREFLAYFEARTDLFDEVDSTPRPDPMADTREADLVADQKWPAQDGTVVDLGPNWNYFATWPTLGGVGLTRTGLMKPLAFTYTKTGSEKYARAWNDMILSTFRNVPCPLKSGVITQEGRIRPTIPAGISGTLWDSISIAARLHHETFYNRFRKSPLFTFDARMAWWVNLTEMADTLERMDAGGNWTTQNASSLFSFAQKYPEFKKADKWFAQGFEVLKANFLENMYPDGPCREATTGYHCFSLGMFLNSFRRAKEIGLEVQDEVMDRLESSFAYTMYTTQPDWQLPVWGDTNRPLDPTGLIEAGGRYFGRQDMIWVGTRGKEGTAPKKCSVDFPQAGYFIMRSGWDPQARFLVTRNGFSQSHYHSDNLGIIVNAFGTDLLPDAGIYTYGTPECNELVKTNRHSTVCVNDRNIAAGNGASAWSTMSGFDYYEGTAPGYDGLQDVQFRRAVLFVKPDYWIVADRVTGPGDHTATQRWRFAPGNVSMDASGVARTANTSGGNIAVIPLLESGRSDRMEHDVYALSGTQVVHDAPVALYERKGPLPLSFATVLFPYNAGSSGKVSASTMESVARPAPSEAVGVQVSYSGETDMAAFGASGGAALRDRDGRVLTATADAAMVRTDKAGRVRSFGWRMGSELEYSGKTLATAGAAVTALSVVYDGGTVAVETEGAPTGLRVATLGARQATVNGRQLSIPKGTEMFDPFASAGK